MKIHVEPFELFKNKNSLNMSKVYKVDFNNKNHNKEVNKHINKNKEVNKHTNDNTNQCNKSDFKFKNNSYHSKYDSTRCIPHKAVRKNANHTYKCINENTGYNVLDNCIIDGNCRINEDVINMFPVKTN